MRRLLRTAAALAMMGLVLLPAGCWPKGRHCERCESAVVQDGPDQPTRLIKGRCVIKGREIDCATASRDCPECSH